MSTVLQRKQRLEYNLKKVVASLKEKYHPEKIILFGSMASGDITETSDIDLLIIKETTKGFFDRLREVVTLCDYNVGVDIIVYTPEEYERACEKSLFFREEILKKGKVIYEGGV